MRRLVIAMMMIFAASGAWPGAAKAGCAASAAGLGFGSVPSYDVQTNAVATAAGLAGLTCSGSFLGILGGSYAKATITSSNNFKLRSAANEQIDYQLSADPGGTIVFQQGVALNYMNSSLLSLLGIGGGSTFQAPLFGRLLSTPNIAAGTYADTLTVKWDFAVCDGVQATPLVCLPAYTTGNPTVVINVTLVVANDCRISAPNVDFGTAALVSQFPAVTQNILVDCTKGSAPRLNFTTGSAGTTRPWRTMTGSGGNVLQYNIFKPDGTTIWEAPQALGFEGSGALAPKQLQPYLIRVNPEQPTPPAGSYSDTLSVVISF